MEKNKSYKHEVNIKIEGEEWKKALHKAYEKNNKKAKIDGFRPGKAPYEIFVKHYGIENLFIDAADSCLQESYLKAITDSKLIPVTEPKVDIKEIDENHVEFIFTIITKPEIKIKKYEGLKIKKDKLEVKEPKTKVMAQALTDLKVTGKTLIILSDKNENVYLSSRNIEGVKAIQLNMINVFDLLNCNKLVLPLDTVKKLEEVYA